MQPFVEYELHVNSKLSFSAGIKSAYYNQTLDQFPDNGKTIGCPGGKLSGKAGSATTTCIGGVSFVHNSANYNSWLPSLSAHYYLKSNWSAYAQFATGSVIPPSNIFDVSNALVGVLPKPTTVKTWQLGTVWKRNRFTLDMDAYYSNFQNSYNSLLDPASGEPIYVQSGNSITKGVELESNILIGHGLSMYVNGTAGKANYQTSGLWVANAPRNTEAVGLTYQKGDWDVGFFNKRIGQMYNDNARSPQVNQAVLIHPFNITNMYLNYTIKERSHFQQTKIRLSVTNVFDQHNIVGVPTAALASSLPSPGDVLTLLPGRSISISITGGFALAR